MQVGRGRTCGSGLCTYKGLHAYRRHGQSSCRAHSCVSVRAAAQSVCLHCMARRARLATIRF
jgi:hypothetical protein